MFYIILFGLIGLGIGWLAITYWPALVAVLVIGIGYGVYTYSFTDGGAQNDKAYYCNVLGADTSTTEWKNVMEWTRFDERHLDSSAEDYWAVFYGTDCATVATNARNDPGEYTNVDYKHDKLGYIRRYYYFRDGQVVNLYRDSEQFLWQRALLLRVTEDCNLNRETQVCVPVPSDEQCGWQFSSSYGQNRCNYDTDGRGTLHQIERSNYISSDTW